MPQKSLKKESRMDWGREIPANQVLSDDDIKLGVILRIADATEAMAKNYTELQRQLDNYKRWYQEEKERNRDLWSSNYHLRGYITRLKKTIKNVR